MHKRKKRAVIKMFACVVLLSAGPCIAPVAAQDSLQVEASHSIPRSWFRLGVGGTGTYTFIGGGVFFRLRDPLAIGVRGGVALEREVFKLPSEAFWELTPSFAYVALMGSTGMVSVLVGTGLTGGTRRGEFLQRIALVGEEYEKVTFRNLCVTAEIHVAFFVSRSLGLSVAVSGNLNKERSFSGYHIGLQFTQP